MTEKEKQFNQWFDEYADGVKVFEEADMKQAYLQGRAELEKENAELKKELVEKGQHLDLTEKEWGKDLVQMYHFKTLYTKQTDQLTKAKELLERLLITSCNSDVLNLLPNCSKVLRVRVEAEQFLSEVEK